MFIKDILIRHIIVENLELCKFKLRIWDNLADSIFIEILILKELIIALWEHGFKPYYLRVSLELVIDSKLR